MPLFPTTGIGNDELGPVLFARPEGGRELEPIAVLAALDFHELGYQCPTTAVEVRLDTPALSVSAAAVP
jgi:hypothetical protein